MKFGKVFNREKETGRAKQQQKDRPPGVTITKENILHKEDLPAAFIRPGPRTDEIRTTPQPQQQQQQQSYAKKPDNLPFISTQAERRILPHQARTDATTPSFPPWATTNYAESSQASTHAEELTHRLPPLQITNENEAHARGLSPLPEDKVDPEGYDLAPPPEADYERVGAFSLERKSLLLFSKTHLRLVFEDLKLLRKFSAFLVEHRPASVPLLVYHLDARKALAAIKYCNAVTDKLKPLNYLRFTQESFVEKTANDVLKRKAEESFEVLANEDLAAWITSMWMKAVEISIRRRINGSLPSQLRDLSEGLAETFVLSDPARYDNPILFASEEFNRMVQYSNQYVIGKNCRIFQGPKSSPHAVRRLREKLEKGEQHYEPVINYRRDGSPFMNLLMITPLLDGNGTIRYFLGAQIDTSGLLNDFYGFEHLQKYWEKHGGWSSDESDDESFAYEDEDSRPRKNELQELSELFSHDELETVRKHGGRLHHADLQEPMSPWKKKSRLVIGNDDDPSSNAKYDDEDLHSTEPNEARPVHRRSNGSSNSYKPNNPDNNGERPESRIMRPGADPSFLSDAPESGTASFDAQVGGYLGGVYSHYLLVRPAPHLRVLFASPSMRGQPGLVQSPLMDHIGGAATLRQQIEQAMVRGQSVTAKVRWLSSAGVKNPSVQSQSRSRWIHATPLLGRNGEVGVWMVVLVEEERDGVSRGSRGSFTGNSFSSGHHVVAHDSQKRYHQVYSRRERLSPDGDDGSIVASEAELRVDNDFAMDAGLRPPPPLQNGNGYKKVLGSSLYD